MSTNRPRVEPPTVNESPFPVSSEDPTATKTLRNRYAAEMTRRFNALKSAIVEGIVENDAFGISELSPEERAGPRTPAQFEAAQEDRRGGADAGINIRPPRSGEFAYPSDAQKVEAFNDWLSEQFDRGILESAPTRHPRSTSANQAWQNTYLRPAYAAGVTHADAYLVDQNIIPPTQTVDDVFRSVRHADGAGLIFTRAYNELDGVTDAMGQDMSRVLAEGLTRGHNPRKIARELNGRVENVGIHRGRLIARTETIRAHNEGTLNRYEAIGDRVGGVTMLAEHLTARDNDVCDECAALEGRVYSLREARGRIPIHPNCRCTWVPVPADQATVTEPAEFDVVTDSVNEMWDDEHGGRLGRLAARNGMTPEELKAEITEQLERLTEDAEIRTRIDAEALGKVAEQGRFKNQLETRLSKGTYNPDMRREVENAYFNLPGDAPTDHPIYGYLGPRGGGFDDDPGGVRGYGDIIVKFDDTVRDRTTFTYGDSLFSMQAVARNTPNDFGYAAQPVTAPSYRAVGPWSETLKQPPGGSRSIYRDHVGDGYGYFEAQIFGGLDLDDITEVVMTAEKVERRPYLMELLAERGITVRVIDEDD